MAFEGSSHCLGWPVLLYRKRPRASLNCILVDDNGTVIYRGCHLSPAYAEQHRGEEGQGGESETVESSVFKYLSLFQELEGAMGSLLASYDHLMVNLRFIIIFNLRTYISC